MDYKLWDLIVEILQWMRRTHQLSVFPGWIDLSIA